MLFMIVLFLQQFRKNCIIFFLLTTVEWTLLPIKKLIQIIELTREYKKTYNVDVENSLYRKFILPCGDHFIRFCRVYKSCITISSKN